MPNDDDALVDLVMDKAIDPVYVLRQLKKRVYTPETATKCEQQRLNRRQYRHNQKTLDAAHRRFQQWTGPEMELCEREDLTALQVAEMTGRTFLAVKTMRHKLRAGYYPGMK